jgi:hypothetical protein
MDEPKFPKKWTNQKLGEALKLHIMGDGPRDEKLDRVYKAVVIGNGEPPLKETVHNHSNWIRNVNKAAWLIFAALITQAVAIGCGAIVLIVKIYPLLLKLDKLEQIVKTAGMIR